MMKARIKFHNPISKYLFALFVIIFTLSIQLILDEYIDVIHFLLIYPAIFLIGQFAGFWPATFGSLLAAIGISYFFIDPKFNILIYDSEKFIKLTIFMVLSILIAKLLEKNKQHEEELVRLIKGRDELISITSHELKTPLTSLKLHSQLMDRALKKNSIIDIEKFTYFNSETQKHLHRLIRLVEDMLDISRIRSGKLSIQKEYSDLCTSLNEAIKNLSKHKTDQNPVVINSDCTVSLMGNWDLVRMEQAISNLLSNAIKYGNYNPITVSVRIKRSMGTISITDQGIGISADDQKRIFLRFEQAQNIEKSGLGLGLYITQEIIKAHNGKISLMSELGKGSTFTIEVPLQGKETL